MPVPLHIALYTATDSLSTTVNGKKVRLRFLPSSLLDDSDKKMINKFMVSFNYVYKCAMNNYKSEITKRSRAFIVLVQRSQQKYDR